MTRERGMIFTGEIVRAIQARRKRHTRRVVTVPWHKGKRCLPYEPYYTEMAGKLSFEDEYGNIIPMEKKCPYGVPGDRLWVKETWSPMWREDCDNCDEDPALLDEHGHCKHFYVEYKADTGNKRPGDWPDPEPNGDFGDAPGWKSPIFMPRWASRILLEITDVRVERVQEISDEDAEAEGVDITNASIPGYLRERFRRLWDSINAKRGYSWEMNPWVWALMFKLLEGD